MKVMTETPNTPSAETSEPTSKKTGGRGQKTKSKGHSYIPGKSCIQLGLKHNYVITKSKKSMRCTRCGSTRWLGAKVKKGKKGKKGAPAEETSTENGNNE